MGLTKSKLGIPEDPACRFIESFGLSVLPFEYPCESPDAVSYRRVEKWWLAMQLMHPAVPYDVIYRPEPLGSNERFGRGVSWYSTSTRFETLSPLTRLLVTMTIADMKKSPDHLQRLTWPTGCLTAVWVQEGARTIRIEYGTRKSKFIAIYTYVHLTADLKFDRYEYYANLW